MSENTTRNNSKNNKIIGASVAGAVLLAGAGSFGVYHIITDDEARENVVNTAQDFKPVSLPDDSKELTAVPDAPVGQLDSSDSAYLNVDMQGKKIQEDNDNEDNEQEVDTNTDKRNNKTTTNKNKNSNRNHTDTQNNSSHRKHKNPTAEDMKQVSNIGKRFKAPSVGLDVQLGAMNEVNGLVKPTNFTNAFTIRNRGIGENLKKAKNGTLYIAMHATDVGSIAPGNFLVDNNTRSNRLKEGDTVEVGKLKYKITEYKREGKNLIAQDKELWNGKTKNRIVILTCFPNSMDNAVFIGELVS